MTRPARSVPTTALRETIDHASAKEGRSLASLIVMSKNRDPFAIDKPGYHRDGDWFADLFARAARPRIHLRGLHYVAVTSELVKPNGSPYRNTERDWSWLQDVASKAGRWLGKVPFDAVVDERNEQPRRYEPTDDLKPIIDGLNLETPRWQSITPEVFGAPRQPYRVVVFAEKASAGPVLDPLAQIYGLTLYLGAGDISDTLLHQIACEAVDDGRPLILLTLCDADPSGWNMPIAIGRKLQALAMLEPFRDLDYRIRRVGLTPEQVRRFGLPSTPLKDTEKRADDWRRATGTAQTELDALATLQPEVLVGIADDAIAEVLDATLAERTDAAASDWRADAETAIAAQVDPEVLARIDARQGGITAEVEQLAAERQGALAAVALPPFEAPQAIPLRCDDDDRALIDSDWSWVEQTDALLRSRRYEDTETTEARA